MLCGPFLSASLKPLFCCLHVPVTADSTREERVNLTVPESHCPSWQRKYSCRLGYLAVGTSSDSLLTWQQQEQETATEDSPDTALKGPPLVMYSG